MSRDDASDGREAHAGALEIDRGVQPLEHTEQLIDVLHVEAGPIVPNRVHRLAVLGVPAELDPGPRLLGGILPAVPEQVVEHDPE